MLKSSSENLGCIAVVPAKRNSRRVEGKNTRPFWRGKCLVEIKLHLLSQCPSIIEVIVNSNDDEVLTIADKMGARAVLRSESLCGDHVDLGELFEATLGEVRSHPIYWAHATSPFVRVQTVDRAVEIVHGDNQRCVLGVERLQEFLWNDKLAVNYQPSAQPRSQDLEPLWRVTGGVHVAMGSRFIDEASLAFDPVRFLETGRIEGLDINTPEDWEICSRLADEVLPSLMP